MNDHEPIAHIEGIKHCYGKSLLLIPLTFKSPPDVKSVLSDPTVWANQPCSTHRRTENTDRRHSCSGQFHAFRDPPSRCLLEYCLYPQGLGQNLYATLSVYENVDFSTSLGYNRDERNERTEALKATNLKPLKPACRTAFRRHEAETGLCALIHDPDVLIMDEPTTGVDPLHVVSSGSLSKV